MAARLLQGKPSATALYVTNPFMVKVLFFGGLLRPGGYIAPL